VKNGKKKMSGKRRMRRAELWLVLLILAITIVLVVAIQLHWFRFRFSIAGELSHHWIGWLGAGFIGIFLPIFSILKRKYPSKLGTLIPIHIFGNLLSFTAIAVHFTHQLTRPPQAFPALGTGVALIIALLISVISGFVMRFQLARTGYKSWRWVHIAVILSFYIIAVIHILHGARVPGF
jgi:hypothetical protein